MKSAQSGRHFVALNVRGSQAWMILSAGVSAADAQLREVQLQEAILATCQAHIRLHAANAELDMCRAGTAALCHLADCLAVWRAEAALAACNGAAPPPATQLVFELDVSLHASLQVGRVCEGCMLNSVKVLFYCSRAGLTKLRWLAVARCRICCHI